MQGRLVSSTISWPDRGWKFLTGTSWVQAFSDCTNEQGHLSHDINTHLLDSTMRWLELLQFLAEWERKEWLLLLSLFWHVLLMCPSWAISAGQTERRWGCPHRDPLSLWPRSRPSPLGARMDGMSPASTCAAHQSVGSHFWNWVSGSRHMLCRCIFLVLLLFSSD